MPSREGPLDRRGGPLLEYGGCPAGASFLIHNSILYFMLWPHRCDMEVHLHILE